MSHERMKEQATENFVVLLKVCHRNVNPPTVAMLIADIISVLQGVSLFTPETAQITFAALPARSLLFLTAPKI